MEVYGGPWRFMEVYGGLWRFMEVYGGCWMSIDVYGSDDDDGPECLEDCIDFDQYNEQGSSENPDGFCTWLTQDVYNSDCERFPC